MHRHCGTNNRAPTSISQTFRSWAATFHLRQPMAFFISQLIRLPGLALLMNVLFKGRCRNPKCSNVAKCSNYYILPCNCIDIYRQNVVIYYKTGYHFLDIYRQNVVIYYKTGYNFWGICSLNVVTWNYYNKDQVCMGNKILNVHFATLLHFGLRQRLTNIWQGLHGTE